jgi:hypothetical protein
VNVAGALSLLSVGGSVGSPATVIVLSLLMFVFLSPLSFDLVFFVLYKALMKGSGLRFLCGMITFVIWTGILVFNVIGIRNAASVGFITMIDVFNSNSGVGAICLIFCIMGCVGTALMIFAFLWLLRYYKRNGLKEKAKAEAASAAIDYAKEHPDAFTKSVG